MSALRQIRSLLSQALDRGACLFTYEDTMVNFQLEDVTCIGNFAGKWGGCFSLAEANINVTTSVFTDNQVRLLFQYLIRYDMICHSKSAIDRAHQAVTRSREAKQGCTGACLTFISGTGGLEDGAYRCAKGKCLSGLFICAIVVILSSMNPIFLF